jgi:hypothetical protein
MTVLIAQLLIFGPSDGPERFQATCIRPHAGNAPDIEDEREFPHHGSGSGSVTHQGQAAGCLTLYRRHPSVAKRRRGCGDK